MSFFQCQLGLKRLIHISKDHKGLLVEESTDLSEPQHVLSASELIRLATEPGYDSSKNFPRLSLNVLFSWKY